jgi:hypothetical protein
MKIEEALESITKLIRNQASPFLLVQVLMSDGFDLRQSETILRWSIQSVIREKELKRKF